MIDIVKGDLTEQDVDAIVNPANSLGIMRGGVARIIRDKGGVEIEREAIDISPIQPGTAVTTTAGSLKAKHVIHAPTMLLPSQRTNVEAVTQAMKGAFECAKKSGIKTIAFPGMGTGIGGVEYNAAAEAMCEEARKFEKDFDKIVFVAFNEELQTAFMKYGK